MFNVTVNIELTVNFGKFNNVKVKRHVCEIMTCH